MSTESSDIARARRVVGSMPVFPAGAESSAAVERLGGLTNLVFKIDCGGERFVLRIPGKGTEEYIDRVNEGKAARAAARALVSPDVLHFDDKSGIMVSRFIDAAVTMSPDLFQSRQGSPARAGQAFRRLHDSGAAFPFRFELFKMIGDYLGILSTKDVDLPDGYHDVVRAAGPVRQALEARELPLAPCHCDPLCENFLDTGERMWIVDWEYSGMNDPMWDLGDLSVEGGFTARQDREMIEAYFGRPATDAEHGRIVIYKAMCDLLWTLWGLIQHANRNPADDFWAYATRRFERFKALMAEPEFEDHVAAVRRG
jgi:thiamine kinase-like enzyme